MNLLRPRAWTLIEAKAPLECSDLPPIDPGVGEVTIQVLGNGVCHTDLGFADGGVRPHLFPVVLGHEMVGRVVSVGEGAEVFLGRTVIVPAVLPCGECVLCRRGRGNACPKQKMPGNDIHGGFASHARLPARSLVLLDPPTGVDVRAFSVVADAVSTAWQATRRAGIEAGQLAIVVGAGGVGGFVIQICAALGVPVIALDASPARLVLMASHGATHGVLTRDDNGKDRDVRDLRDEVGRLSKALGIPSWDQRVFECAGLPTTQQIAYTLLGRAGVMIQVGFSSEKTNLRLSNLMAFDATIHGSWGCPPEAYAPVLDLVARGLIALDPFVEYRPLDDVNQVLDDMRSHRLTRRVVLDPSL